MKKHKKYVGLILQMNKNKRGQAEEFLENAFRLGFMFIALLIFFLLVNLYVTNKIDTRLLQAETLANRIVYSDTIMYSDPYTYRAYAGIVDMSKFNDGVLNGKIGYAFTKHAAAKLKLYEKPVQGQENFITEAYINREQYKIWKAMIDSGTSGKGSAVMTVKEFPATCLFDAKQGTYKYCTLVVEVIVPNS
jgi:hypothetical protein